MKNIANFEARIADVLLPWVNMFKHSFKRIEASLKPKFKPPPQEWLDRRRMIVKEYGLLKILKFKVIERYRLLKRDPNAVHLPFFSDREDFVFHSVAVMLMAFAMFSNVALQASSDLAVPKESRTIVASRPLPENWLTGSVNLADPKTAFTAAYGYANTAEYPIVGTETELARLVEDNRLVPVSGAYVKSDDSMYALPEVVTFANRLGFMSASHGCGKLEVSNALLTRPPSASDVESAVRATGMVISITRTPTNKREDTFCHTWLKDILGDIEATRRIDATLDGNEFEVIVVPSTYAAWLKKQYSLKELEINLLADALFFEAPFKASKEELRAIGWVIKNRAASTYYPSTVVEVIAEGAAGRSAGSCQFSFMCDGKAEAIQLLCGNRVDEFWQQLCSDRYATMQTVAAQVLNEKKDPTHGAVLYYASWLHNIGKAPAWVSDMKYGTVLEIGDHRFGCSKYRGRDICKKKKGVQS